MTYDADLGAAVLLPERDYRAGEQLYDSYGPEASPQDLLLQFGFVDTAKMLDHEHYGVAVPLHRIGELGGLG